MPTFAPEAGISAVIALVTTLVNRLVEQGIITEEDMTAIVKSAHASMRESGKFEAAAVIEALIGRR